MQRIFSSLSPLFLVLYGVGIIIVLGLLAGFMEFLPENKAYACEAIVPGPPVEQALDNSVAVFAGKVVKIQKFTTEVTGDWRTVFFEVDSYWKTPPNNPNENSDYEQLLVFTAIDGGACGYDFEVGKTYLVYATTWLYDPNSLYTGLGHRTQPIEDAKEDLTFLGEGNAPAKEISWDEQENRINVQPLPRGPEEQQESAILSMVGIGAAIAGTVAFFSLRMLKGRK